jgi:hypothetical protein
MMSHKPGDPVHVELGSDVNMEESMQTLMQVTFEVLVAAEKYMPPQEFLALKERLYKSHGFEVEMTSTEMNVHPGSGARN